jgi:hypothetical protein
MGSPAAPGVCVAAVAGLLAGVGGEVSAGWQADSASVADPMPINRSSVRRSTVRRVRAAIPVRASVYLKQLSGVGVNLIGA